MDKENDIVALLKVLNSYRLLILLCLAVFAAGGLLSQLAAPKVYQAEALVSLPIIASTESREEDTTTVTVAETRALVNLFWNRLRRGNETGLGSDTLLQKMTLVRVDDVRGSGRYLKLIVQSASDPQSALATMDHLVDYLKNNQFLTGRYEIKKAELDSGLKDAGLALERAAKVKEETAKLIRERNNLGVNPVELETKMSELRGRYNNLKTRLALAQNYQYVDRPYVRTDPVSPRPWRDFFLFGFLGLLLGVMLSILVHFIRTVIVPGVKNSTV
jgi:LPS O-antigen subunit length determinant protein (WzzB/FepE family)